MLNQYLDQLLAQSRLRVTMIEEMTSILSDVQDAEDQLIGRLSGLGRFAQQEARPLRPQPHESVQYAPPSSPPIAPPQPVAANPNPNVAASTYARFVEHPAQPRPQPPAATPPPPNPIGQHPISGASYQLRQLLKNTDEAVRSFLPNSAPPPVPQQQRKRPA